MIGYWVNGLWNTRYSLWYIFISTIKKHLVWSSEKYFHITDSPLCLDHHAVMRVRWPVHHSTLPVQAWWCYSGGWWDGWSIGYWQTENIPVTFIHVSRDKASVPFYQISPDINWFMYFCAQQLMSIDDRVITWTDKITLLYVILYTICWLPNETQPLDPSGVARNLFSL